MREKNRFERLRFMRRYEPEKIRAINLSMLPEVAKVLEKYKRYSS